MLRIRSGRHRLCDGSSRRDFLRVGSVGALGLTLPALLQHRAEADAPDRSFGRARRCVLLFLTGGPPQLDTWDLKPEAPAEVRGELSPIPTNVPGIRISELFPGLARHAEKYCIVRSVTHEDTIHTSAGYTMLTGMTHRTPNAGTAKNIVPRSDDHPHLGSILSFARPAQGGLPSFVAMPEIIRDDAVNVYPGQDGGFLGKQYSPFLVNGDAKAGAFQRPEIALPAEMSVRRLQGRRGLLAELDRRFAAVDGSGRLEAMDHFYQRAFDMIASPAARRAFELEREPEPLRAQYGDSLFGQGCLLARRLLEAGVSLVTVYWQYDGPKDSPVWDTHQRNFTHLRDRLMPPTDRALSALLADLQTRGMLDDTLVVCMGEFGRSPKINSSGGREHWPQAQSVLLAGGGIRGGSVYGATDAIGAYPADLPVTPQDLTATFLHVLGLRPDLELHDQVGRQVRACEGTPIGGLFA